MPPAAETPVILCGHCGEPQAGYARIFDKDNPEGTPVCHPGNPAKPDCYRRIHVYMEKPGALIRVRPLPGGVEGFPKDLYAEGRRLEAAIAQAVRAARAAASAREVA